MHKVALITRQSPPDWVSCKSISANLSASYVHIPQMSYQKFYFEPHHTEYDGRRVALQVADWQPDAVVFLDHNPAPTMLIKFWQELTPQFNPEIRIHVYGDFSLNAQKWIDCENSIRKFSIQFICASPKQAQIVDRFLAPSSQKLTKVVPFPVDDRQFRYDDALRLETRSRRSVSKETLFLYSGRLSLQKNILVLLRAFELYQRVIDRSALLHLAGPIDDLCNPYLGKKAPHGLMNYDLQILIHELFPGDRRRNVVYLGNISSEELNAEYNAADFYISMSTHHDEDFGMAPAEAMLTGLSCILSDWGGFSAFKHYSPDQVRLVPVQTHGSSVSPSEVEILKVMIAAEKVEAKARQTFSTTSRARFSSMAVSKQLAALSGQSFPFNGFSPLFHRLAQSLSSNPTSPLGFGKTYSSLYKDIYSEYRN